MADNYLENKFEELKSKHPVKKTANSNHKHMNINDLILKNRSYRGFDTTYVVSEAELRECVDVATKVPSARNQQALRFKLVTAKDAMKVLPHTRWAGALAELNLPFEGTVPNAFIVICTPKPEDRWVPVDLGIAAQSILLKAVDMGLNGICIGAFNRDKIMEELGLALEPILVLAIGKGIERIQLTSIGVDDDYTYYRKDGVHFVPKVKLEDIIL